MAMSGLRKNAVLSKIILNTDGTNGYTRGDRVSKGKFGTPWWRTILTSAVGVMHAVWFPVWQEGV